jgi:hypothetical protein
MRHIVRLIAFVVSSALTACSPAPSAVTAPDVLSSAQPVFAGGHDLFSGDGKKIALHGLNFFGFNNGQTMVDGIWGGPSLALDFATVAYRQQLLGFNAVRLPFSFKDLINLKPKNFAQACTLPTQAQVAQSVLKPGQQMPAHIPAQAYPPHYVSGQCNGYIPNDSVWNRFKWVVSFYARNNFYVLIDNHLREDTSALDNADAWAANWAKLVKELSSDSVVKQHLMVDLLNEPDQYGLQWGAQNGKPGLGDLYIKAMDAIEAVAPKTLYFIEGTGQGGLQANWGDGFATDNVDIGSMGLSNPRPFFAMLLSKPYAKRVVLAPHVYGPAVTTNDKGSSGAELVSRLTKSFGHLTKDGFCTGKTCHTFPVAIGEFGSKLTDARDVATLSGLSDYLQAKGAGDDGQHYAISNWFWWSWNADSGDTGGLVTDDWVSLQWGKLDLLAKLGLRSPLG